MIINRYVNGRNVSEEELRSLCIHDDIFGQAVYQMEARNNGLTLSASREARGKTQHTGMSNLPLSSLEKSDYTPTGKT